ncbi:hypothetical protein THAR02_09597 [Trichoderma harzianum]|uniref:Uncharacterized protein n=1 Tax=Trichoderma harzianum TaxID=5544 RepID=A0A0F9X0U0_TRIHA|nr:hypothetical protein THAR02_09597 [Trichoderma harzianum]
MGIQRRKKRRLVPAIGSPQRHKLRELCSRAILEQVTYNEATNMPDIHLGVEAEPYMMDVPPTEPWLQPDNDSDILFNPSQMNVSESDIDLGVINASHQMYYSGITPGQPLGCNNNLEGLDLYATWDSPQYSEMASPSSQTESTGPSDAPLSPSVPICLT